HRFTEACECRGGHGVSAQCSMSRPRKAHPRPVPHELSWARGHGQRPNRALTSAPVLLIVRKTYSARVADSLTSQARRRFHRPKRRVTTKATGSGRLAAGAIHSGNGESSKHASVGLARPRGAVALHRTPAPALRVTSEALGELIPRCIGSRGPSAGRLG